MALTTAQVRRYAAGRVALAGLSESASPLGPTAEPDSVIHRSFSVTLPSDIDSGMRTKTGGILRVEQTVLVTLAHKGRAKAGPDVWDAALDDRDRVRAQILNHHDDGLREAEGSIRYGGGETRLEGGGLYLLTTLRWSITFDLDLTIAGAS